METTYRERCATTGPHIFPNSDILQRSTSGDFSSILHEVISKRSSVIQGTLTIDDLNRYLDEITENIGKQDNQSKILQKIYNRATPDEQRWIVRIILKGGRPPYRLCGFRHRPEISKTWSYPLKTRLCLVYFTQMHRTCTTPVPT